MARAPRILFAAPFVMIATAACHPSGGGGNPPRQTYYASWNVSKSGDTCMAMDAGDMSCPEGASCNPPPPMQVDCPAGLSDSGSEGSVFVYQKEENGACYLGTDDSETPCPHWQTASDCVPAGCSGIVCADADQAGDIMTTCEYRPEYDCYKSATCERQADGACGWTQTDELTACLGGAGGGEDVM